jgi:hypothetical protein
MKKDFVGFRTDYKEDYRRVRDALGLSTLTEAHEAIMRAVTQPWLPQSAAVLKVLERTQKNLVVKTSVAGPAQPHASPLLLVFQVIAKNYMDVFQKKPIKNEKH